MEETKIQLGDLAKDKITGFEGIVVSCSTFLHNTDRAQLQPRELKEGRPQDSKGFDVSMLQLIEKHAVLTPPPLEHEFKLGDQAKDQLSECKGVITCLTEYITGCTHAVIQSAQMKDGHPVEGIYFPVTQLDLIQKAEETPETEKSGGPVREARAYLP